MDLTKFNDFVVTSNACKATQLTSTRTMATIEETIEEAATIACKNYKPLIVCQDFHHRLDWYSYKSAYLNFWTIFCKPIWVKLTLIIPFQPCLIMFFEQTTNSSVYWQITQRARRDVKYLEWLLRDPLDLNIIWRWRVRQRCYRVGSEQQQENYALLIFIMYSKNTSHVLCWTRPTTTTSPRKLYSQFWHWLIWQHLLEWCQLSITKLPWWCAGLLATLIVCTWGATHNQLAQWGRSSLHCMMQW